MIRVKMKNMSAPPFTIYKLAPTNMNKILLNSNQSSSKSQSDQNTDYKICISVFSQCMQYYRVRTLFGWHDCMLICPVESTFLPEDCWMARLHANMSG